MVHLGVFAKTHPNLTHSKPNKAALRDRDVTLFFFLFHSTKTRIKATPSLVIWEVCMCVWCMHALAQTVFTFVWLLLLLSFTHQRYVCACRIRLNPENTHTPRAHFYFLLQGVPKHRCPSTFTPHPLNFLSYLWMNSMTAQFVQFYWSSVSSVLVKPVQWGGVGLLRWKVVWRPLSRHTSYCSEVSLWIFGG